MKNYKRLCLATAAMILTVLQAGSQALHAQVRRTSVTVSGHITDKDTGESLIGAGAVTGDGGSSASRTGTVTNDYGFYSMTIPAGKATIIYSYIGYGQETVTADLQRDTTIDVAMEANSTMAEAVVSANRESGIQSTRMSAVEIPMNMIRNTPSLFGEADVLKTVQLMPGVQSGAEGFSGIYVRGGGPDENLLLLDGIPLYNAEHMLGLFSVFQSEAVKKVTLYKGSFPARYGGRTSSIIDVRTNDGNMYETHGTVGVGAISDKFHLEGPLLKGRTAYSVSLRGMHTFLFDRILRAFDIPANYYFYDFNAKLTHRLGKKDRLFLNFYGGRDIFYFKDEDEDGSAQDGSTWTYGNRSDIKWGNTVAAARWNHVFNGRLFSNATLAWTGYRMDMGFKTSESNLSDGKKTTYDYKFNYQSGLRDITAKVDFDYTPSPSHQVRFGGEYVYHTYIPETYTTIEHQAEGGKAVVDTTIANHRNKASHGHEYSIFIEDDLNVGEIFTLNPGMHLSMFVTGGRTYWSPEPRVSVKASLGKGFVAKAAYSRMAQYVHLLSSARITLPLDLWVPITRKIRPVTSDQVSLGLYHEGLRGWEFSVEAYLKKMDNVLEYKDGVSFLANSQGWEDNVVMGSGSARGIELFIQKTMGRTTGWLGYTLAWSDRIFPDGSINNGERFPYRYDRRHNISLVLNQQFGTHVDLSATWQFATGGTTTVPEREVAFEQPDGTFVQVDYAPHRNNYRLPPSHRLNVGINLHIPRSSGESIWNISVYNAYNRMNPNFVFYSSGERYISGTGLYYRNEKLKALTLLPIIPSIGYTRKF